MADLNSIYNDFADGSDGRLSYVDRLGTPSTDVVIMPFPDISFGSPGAGLLRNIGSTIGSLASIMASVGLRGIRLTTVTQLEYDKGNVVTAHRVDGGYVLTQRGGNQDDIVFIRFILTGPNRYFTKELLGYMADDKSVPLAFLSREAVFIKCQIESLKVIVVDERRQTIVMHLVFRQLRSAATNLITFGIRAGVGAISGSFLFGENIYSAQNRVPGASGSALIPFDIGTAATGG